MSELRMGKKNNLVKTKTFLYSTLSYYEWFYFLIFFSFVLFSFFLYFWILYYNQCLWRNRIPLNPCSPSFPLSLFFLKIYFSLPLIFPSFSLKLIQLYLVKSLMKPDTLTVKTKLTPTTITQTSLSFPYLSLIFRLFPSLYIFLHSLPVYLFPQLLKWRKTQKMFSLMKFFCL